MSLDVGTLDEGRRWSEVIGNTHIVFEDAGRYYTKDGKTGRLLYQGGSCASAIQTALDSGICNDIKLNLIGEHTLNAGLTMTNRNTKLGGLHAGSTASATTVLKLGSQVNTVMLTLTADFCTIENLVFDGNKTNQTGNHNGILMDTGSLHIVLNYVFVHDCGNYGITLIGANNEIYNSTVKDCNYGWYLVGCVEFTFCRELKASGCTRNILVANSDGVKIFGLWSTLASEGGVYFQNCSNIEVYGTYIELNQRWGIAISDGQNITVTGGTVRNNSQAGGSSYSDIYIGDYSSANSFNNRFIGLNIYADTGTVSKYAVEEKDANQNFNYVINCNIYGQGVGPYLLLGANSRADDNIGALTVNEGVVTLTSGLTSVTQNLSGVIINVSGSPTGVMLTPISDFSKVSGVACYVSATNSGSFTVSTSMSGSDSIVFAYRAFYNV